MHQAAVCIDQLTAKEAERKAKGILSLEGPEAIVDNSEMSADESSESDQELLEKDEVGNLKKIPDRLKKLTVN